MGRSWQCIWLIVALGGPAVGGAGAQPVAQSPGFNRACLDTTCSPCRDFWRFANGAWLDSVRIPPARSRWGRDDIIRSRNDSLIRSLLDSLAYAPARYAHTPPDRNVGDFFRSCRQEGEQEASQEHGQESGKPPARERLTMSI